MANSFKDFGIKPALKKFTGEKIKIEKILNREIVVHDWKIEDSKYVDKGDKCLYLQIEFAGEKRVLFSGSKVLMDMIAQVPIEKFPFSTTIVKQDEHLEFS